MLEKLLNHLGLFTSKQYIEQVEAKSAIAEYANLLERIANRLPDPAKPIIAKATGSAA